MRARTPARAPARRPDAPGARRPAALWPALLAALLAAGPARAQQEDDDEKDAPPPEAGVVRAEQAMTDEMFDQWVFQQQARRLQE